jgi:hypothetical protein
MRAGEAHWSWWRVLLPFWVVLGHNILYVAIGLVGLSVSDKGAAEEAVTIRQGHGWYGYQVAALVCFVVFADNVLRRMEGQQETMFFWVSSGRWETIVVFWDAQCDHATPVLVYDCGSRSPNAPRVMLSGIQFIFQRTVTLFDEFFDHTR